MEEILKLTKELHCLPVKCDPSVSHEVEDLASRLLGVVDSGSQDGRQISNRAHVGHLQPGAGDRDSAATRDPCTKGGGTHRSAYKISRCT